MHLYDKYKYTLAHPTALGQTVLQQGSASRPWFLGIGYFRYEIINNHLYFEYNINSYPEKTNSMDVWTF